MFYTIIILKLCVTLCNLEKVFYLYHCFCTGEFWEIMRWKDGWTHGRVFRWMDWPLGGWMFDGIKKGKSSERREKGNSLSPFPQIGGMNWGRGYYSFNLIFLVIQIWTFLTVSRFLFSSAIKLYPANKMRTEVWALVGQAVRWGSLPTL